MRTAADIAKKFQMECERFDGNNDVVDIGTIFDGSWNNRGWTSSRGVVSAVAENTSLSLDVP